jgi:hypothetical protein
MDRPKSLLLAACLIGVLALSGCAGGAALTAAASAPTPTPTPTKTVPPNGEHYSSVTSLRSAYLTAGGDCPAFNETNQVARAAESGTCGTGSVLSIYSSSSDRDAVVDGMKQFADLVGMNLLVGENWIINDKNVSQYRSKLGGTLVTRTAKE